MATVDRVAEGDLDWPTQSVDLTGVTELRVHGVGGTLPEAMLDDRDVHQVTGDTTAGMWRGADRTTPSGNRWHREAYSWGGLTSRALTSALWLILLPFALINLAGWMALGRPRRSGGRVDWRIGYQQSLLRTIALGATWTYVLFAAQIAMDLGAWQCTQVSRCRLRTWPDTVVHLDALAGHPARAVVLAASAPLLLIATLHMLTVTTRRNYEAYGSPHADGQPGSSPDDPDERREFSPAQATLSVKSFWRGAAYDPHSHRLHVLSSIVVVAMLLLAVAHKDGRHPVQVQVAVWACGVMLALAAVAAGWDRLQRRLLRTEALLVTARVLSFGMLIWAAALAWLQPASSAGDPQQAAPDVMPGILTAYYILIVSTYTLGILHGVVALAGRIAAWRAGAAQPSGHRLPLVPGPFTTMSIGIWLLFAVWAGFLIFVAQWLSPRAVSDEGAISNRLVYPVIYEGIVELTIAWIVVLAVVLAVILGSQYLILRLSNNPSAPPPLTRELSVWSRMALPGGAQAAQPLDRTPWRPTPWLRRVRTRKWLANVGRWIEYTLGAAAIIFTVTAIGFGGAYGWGWLGTDLLRAVAGVVIACAGLTVLLWSIAITAPTAPRRRTARERGLVGLSTAILLATAAACYWGLRPAIDTFDQRPKAGSLPVWLAWLTANAAVTSTLLTAIPLGSVLLVRQALRDPNTRRLIGIAWDVATFWPRAFHPLAPPSYAERSVPELEGRLRALLLRGAVLLGGHSQGAVVCTAALAQLTDLPVDQRDRLSVVTYGNPTAYLYMRWFPHYVYDDLLRDTQGGNPGLRWINFYRDTDYIGLKPLDPAAEQPEPHLAVSGWRHDVWLPDPPTYWYRDGDGLPRVRGHAHEGYERQSPFAAHIAAEVDRLSAKEVA
jgi:hypothetical protein